MPSLFKSQHHMDSTYREGAIIILYQGSGEEFIQQIPDKTVLLPPTIWAKIMRK